MADYIRRDDALFALRKAERGGSMTALTRLERAYAEIREMPAADVAEVVRCKDCEYLVNTTINANGFLICDISDMEIAQDDFCSYGERMEE